jgi:hypothetical protein
MSPPNQKEKSGKYYTLSKGLNYAVAPAVLPVEDILCGLEKAIGNLPEEKC